jgi:hypothetical protein
MIRDGGGSSKPTVSSTIINKANTFKPGVPASLVKPPAPKLTPNQADRQAQAAIIERDRASSLAAFKASGLGAAGFISMTDSRAASAASNVDTKGGSFQNTASAPPSASLSSSPTVETNNEVQATPPEITTDTPAPAVDTSIKAAPIDTVLFVDEGFSQEFITDLLFEDIAGQELLSIARDDTVNGQKVIYQPIKNLGILRDTYDVNNLLKLQETSDRFFANFLINLFEKIPKVGNGPDGKNYYLDNNTGDGIIEFVNMRTDEQVEVQISNAGIIEELGI